MIKIIRKNIKLIILCITLIFVGFFGFKRICLSIYEEIDYKKYDASFSNYKIDKHITLRYIEPKEKVSLQNVSFKNDFKNFELYEDSEYAKKYLMNDNGYVSAFFVTIDYSYLYYFVYGKYDSKFNKIDKDKLIEKHHITNDLELFDSIFNNRKKRSNIVTSITDMKYHYALMDFANKELPSFGSMTKIDGTYFGYLFSSNDSLTKEANLIIDHKRYIFTFINTTYFTDAKILEILNSVSIEQ